jgi:hypothetical protein
VFVLSVQVDKTCTKFSQCPRRDENLVHKTPAPSGRGQFAPDKDLAALMVKDRLDYRYFFACPNHVSRCPVAQEQAYGSDHHRLAGTRLARQDIQSRLECHFQRLDDRQVPDVQVSQHRFFFSGQKNPELS